MLKHRSTLIFAMTLALAFPLIATAGMGGGNLLKAGTKSPDFAFTNLMDGKKSSLHLMRIQVYLCIEQGSSELLGVVHTGEVFDLLAVEGEPAGAVLKPSGPANLGPGGTERRPAPGTVLALAAGVAEPGPNLSKPAEVIKAADQALYRAKKKGRNCVAT